MTAITCPTCQTATVVGVGAFPGSAQRWRCSACKEVRRRCPRCEQGWVCHGLLRSPALSVYICEECEALWQSPFTIGLVGAFEDFNTLMQRTGRPGGWSEVEIVRHIEHRARITWSAERTAEGLLPVQSFTVPAWFSDSKDGAWSLICTFAIAPNEQG